MELFYFAFLPVWYCRITSFTLVQAAVASGFDVAY